MNDRTVTGLTPAEEDPGLHRYLVMLPVEEPRAGFEDRVLSRVWRPHPHWYGRMRSAGLELIETGEIWFWISTLALGSLLPLIAGAVLTTTFASEIGSGITWLIREGIPTVWAAAAADVTWHYESVASQVSALGLGTLELGMLGLGCLTVLMGCVWGLRRTMIRVR